MSKRLNPVPEGQVERGHPPVVTDESQNAPPPPPPPSPQPEAAAAPSPDTTVPAAGTPPPAAGPVPPTPPPEVEEVARVLASPDKITKEGVDEAYRSLARRRATLHAEILRMDAGLARLRDIAATSKGSRLSCFGQFDPNAPFCTQTCRDPVCPSYTQAIRNARIASMAREMRAVAERMAETPDTFGLHAPREVNTREGEALADGTRVTVD